VTDRQPPVQTPPKFKVGNCVNVFGLDGIFTITRIQLASKEWLVRTAYAAGYYVYHVIDPLTDKIKSVSENVLTLALIDTLGKITGDE